MYAANKVPAVGAGGAVDGLRRVVGGLRRAVGGLRRGTGLVPTAVVAAVAMVTVVVGALSEVQGPARDLVFWFGLLAGATGLALLYGSSWRGVARALEDASPGRSPQRAVAALEAALVEHGGRDLTREAGAELPGQDIYSAEELLDFATAERTTFSSNEQADVVRAARRLAIEAVSGVALTATAVPRGLPTGCRRGLRWTQPP